MLLKEDFNKIILCKWRPMQLVIQLKTHLSKRARYCSLFDKYMNVNGKSGRIISSFQM